MDDILESAYLLSMEIKKIRKQLNLFDPLSADPVNGLEYIYRKNYEPEPFDQGAVEELGNYNDLILDIHSLICKTANQRCYYCNLPYLNSDDRIKLGRLEQELDTATIADLLIEELKLWAAKTPVGKIPCRTIYMGGNWSLIRLEDIKRIMEVVREHYHLSRMKQITFEFFPIIDDEVIYYLQMLSKEIQIRVSVGLQDTHDPVLQAINRGHSWDEAKRTLQLLLNAGLIVNADLMAGLPGQTEQSILENFQRLDELGLQSISIYPTSLKGTVTERNCLMGPIKERDGIFTFEDTVLDSDFARSMVHLYATRFSSTVREHRPLGWYCLDADVHMPDMIRYQWTSDLFRECLDLSIGMGPTFTNTHTYLPVGGMEDTPYTIRKRIESVRRGVIPISERRHIQDYDLERSLLMNDLRMVKPVDIPRNPSIVKACDMLIAANAMTKTKDGKIALTEAGSFLINEIDEWLCANNDVEVAALSNLNLT